MTEPTRPGRWARWRRRAWAYLVRTLAVIGFVLILYHVFFQVHQVTTSSMQPTLKGSDIGPADWVLSERLTYWLRNPHRWEVATLRYADGNLVAKRIAALPGETISLKDGQVYIGGVRQCPPASVSFLRYSPYAYLHEGLSYPCKPRKYFVLGDDTRDSLDSRFEGAVDIQQIEGRALLRFWPWDRIGFVNP